MVRKNNPRQRIARILSFLVSNVLITFNYFRLLVFAFAQINLNLNQKKVKSDKALFIDLNIFLSRLPKN